MAETSGSAASGDVTHQSLYRRFRPQRFAELRAQPHVALALKNAVREDRIGHAYLFSGPRGTGKTSTARILAKALNCANPQDGEPCGECDSCVSIANGTSYDVHELDAASSNSVDAMRDLIARASLATPGKWKVYIVDEVHMLSNAASNALLKTLEEPPGHVVFVLATTDPQKLLPTIRSRTQHFEFHLFTDAELAELLSDVATRADVELGQQALAGAVRRAKGSARDALSVLDQIASGGVIEDDEDHLKAIVAALAEGNTEILDALDRALSTGRDARQLAVEIIEQLRAGFLLLARREEPSDVAGSMSAEEFAAIQRIGLARCVRTIELLGTAVVAMREAPEPRITLEVAMIRATKPEADASAEAMLERLERLEARVNELAHHGVARAAPPASPPVPQPQTPKASESEDVALANRPSLGAFRQEPSPENREPVEEVAPQPAPSHAPPPTGERPASSMPSRDDLVKAWGDHILISLRPKVRAVYNIGRFIGVEGSDALFALPNKAHVSHAEPLAGEVAATLSAHFSHPVGLKVVIDDSATEPVASESDDELPPLRQRSGSRPTSRPEPVRDELETGDLDDVAAAVEDDDSLAVSQPAGTGLSWAEDRLLQAFPGAEEL
jgi:DNA polymerase-3 subunit gamma/tau